MNAMSAVKEPATGSKWESVVSLLRCNKCHGPLHYESPAELSCPACPRKLRIENNILHLGTEFEGNNAVAAKYYNGTLWPKFRFWEYLSLYLPRGGEKKARNEVLGNLPNLAGTRLLDVAMGDGRNMPLIPKDCQVFGVDISRVLLEKTQHDFPGWDTNLIVGEAEALPFPDGTFDNLFSLGALNHVNNPLLALQEMSRVVKAGGTIAVADEMPDLPNRQIAHKLGLKKLQKWILSRVFFLGEMSEVILEHTDLKIEPLVKEALSDWQIKRIWGGLGYCIVGKPKK